jgi:hypothetical protein
MNLAVESSGGLRPGERRRARGVPSFLMLDAGALGKLIVKWELDGGVRE